jgi:hypothetical protein
MENNFKEQVLTLLAENGGTHTVGGKTFSVTMVEEERKIDTCNKFDIETGCLLDKCICENENKPTPDYSHLVGKWVKCMYSKSDAFTENKWYEFVKIDEDGAPLFIDNSGDENGYTISTTPKMFDLSNPLDYNPDTRIPLPDRAEFYKHDYRLNTFLFKMNEKQILGYDRNTENYFVTSFCDSHAFASCHLEPCQYGDVKEGEFFVLDEAVFLKTKDADVYAEKSGKVDVMEQLISTHAVHRVVRTNN